MQSAKIERLLPYILILLGVLLLLTIWLTYRVQPAASIAPQGSNNARIVVIDAGHGGMDGGATSVSGMLESGINLEIAKKTDAVIRFLGYATVMTRGSDKSLHDITAATIADKKRSDLKNRVKLVNSVPNAVLISVHQNFFEQEQYFGAQIFWNDDASSQSFAVAAQENFRRLDARNTREAKRSSGVYLMSNADCPAILVECGFLSNAGDERNLTRPDYQIKVAAVIAASLSNWELNEVG
ncbi:N-acetylmuramoyl-L-alanine amidase CwlD [Clostridia bacterium]|nr:N-acetylmuramoyl-L-alanine amidase CwlD [Clostridia bacterium]